MPEGWIIPENRALAHRQNLLGLPTGYAALLIMTCLFTALTLEYVLAAAYLLALGWGGGMLVTFYDFYAFELAAKNLRLPKVLRP